MINFFYRQRDEMLDSLEKAGEGQITRSPRDGLCDRKDRAVIDGRVVQVGMFFWGVVYPIH